MKRRGVECSSLLLIGVAKPENKNGRADVFRGWRGEKGWREVIDGDGDLCGIMLGDVLRWGILGWWAGGDAGW